MNRYMVQFSYTAQAWAALAKNPEDRSKPLEALAKKMGGRLLDLYYHFGDFDGTAMIEAPDDVTASAAVIAATVPGHLKAVRTTRLFTVAEAMEAFRKAGTAVYPGPHG